MIKMFYNRLFNHLIETEMSYSSHMKRALKISALCLIASATCFIHSFFPFLFKNIASNIIKDLEADLEDDALAHF